MPKPTKILKTTKKGGYTIHHCVDGTCRLFGPRIKRASGFYLPSEQDILEKYYQDMESGKMSSTTKTRIGWWGVVYSGRRSITEGRNALGIPKQKPPTLIQIQEKIREFWLEEEIKGALRGELSLEKRIIDFKSKYPREFNQAHKNHGGFRSAIKNMPFPYSIAYNLISGKKLSGSINQGRLGKLLYIWFCKGKSIHPSALKRSPANSVEKNSYNQIYTLSRISQSLFHKKSRESPVKVMSRLTGLDKEDISMSIENTKRNSSIVEKIASFLFHWAPIVGLKIEPLFDKEIDESELGLKFSYDGKGGLADLRIGDTAVEIKSFVGAFRDVHKRNLIARYAPGINTWKTGELIEKSLVIFHQHPETYSAVKKEIEKTGIKIMDFQRFHNLLEETISRIKQDKSKIKGISPRANLDYILALDKETLTPSLLIREKNTDRRLWSLDMLNALIERAKQIKSADFQEQEESSLRVPHSRVIRHAGGRFLLMERNFNDIKSGKIGDYIRANRDKLFLDNIRTRFPELRGIPKNKIIAFDIETCGFAYRDPTVSIGFTTFGRELATKSGVLFARDYSEEGPVISYFLKMLEDYEVLITYNGTAFDLPRLDERAKLNGISLATNKYAPLTKALKCEHIDLYPLVKSRVRLPDRKLSTIEKLIFNFERIGGIPSARIPELYRRFVMEGDGKGNVEKIMQHNLFDTVTLKALLTYLCAA